MMKKERGEHEEEEEEERVAEEVAEEVAEIEEKEEKSEVRGVDVAVACSLLGGVAFVMAIFYLVNHYDRDIQLSAWEIVSSTISIFVAVLFFGGVVATTHMLEGSAPHWFMVVAPFMHVLLWYSAMHLAIGYLCWTTMRHDDASYREPSEEDLCELECWSTLLAHICAFATIHFGLHILSGSWFLQNSFTGFVGTALVFGILFVMFRVSDIVRARLCAERKNVLKLWDETAEEAENDVGSLALSFLLVQNIVLAVLGRLTEEARKSKEEPVEEKPVSEASVWILISTAIAFALLRAGVVYISSMCNKNVHLHTLEYESTAGVDTIWDYVKRWIFILQYVISMCFAWSLLFAITWQAGRLLGPLGPMATQTDAREALVATLVSIVAFAGIFTLDYLGDTAGGDLNLAMRSIIKSLGILVGFSWESAFEVGVEVISELTTEVGAWCPVIVRVGMAVIIGLGITPAWTRYILRRVVELRAAHAAHQGEAGERELTDPCDAQAAEALLEHGGEADDSGEGGNSDERAGLLSLFDVHRDRRALELKMHLDLLNVTGGRGVAACMERIAR